MTLLYFAGNHAIPGLYLGWRDWKANYFVQEQDGFRWQWGHLEMNFDYPEGLRRLNLKNREWQWRKRRAATY